MQSWEYISTIRRSLKGALLEGGLLILPGLSHADYTLSLSTHQFDDTSTTATSNPQCLTGSTMTFVMSQAGPLQFFYIGSARNNTTNAETYFGFTLDGVRYPADSRGLFAQTTIVNQNLNFSGSAGVPAVSSGTHTVCLSPQVNAGTATFVGTPGSSSQRNQIAVIW